MNPKLKGKINAFLYQKRAFNLSLVKLQQRMDEMRLCVNDKNDSKKEIFYINSTKMKKNKKKGCK
jgi:hypothetical protein